MKKLIIPILLLLAFTSCQKDELVVEKQVTTRQLRIHLDKLLYPGMFPDTSDNWLKVEISEIYDSSRVVFNGWITGTNPNWSYNFKVGSTVKIRTIDAWNTTEGYAIINSTDTVRYFNFYFGLNQLSPPDSYYIEIN